MNHRLCALFFGILLVCGMSIYLCSCKVTEPVATDPNMDITDTGVYSTTVPTTTTYTGATNTCTCSVTIPATTTNTNVINTTVTTTTSLSEFEWEVTSSGIAITNYLGNSQRVVVPETIHNRRVVSVNNAFTGNIVLEELVLPSGVSWVEVRGCDNLRYLEMQTTEIRGFGNLRLPASVTKLVLPNLQKLPSLIEGGSLEYIDISSVTYIADVHFLGFSNLKELKISKDIKYYSPSPYSGGIAGQLFDSPPEHDVWEITDSNRAQVYCEVFRTEQITINGVNYSLQ